MAVPANAIKEANEQILLMHSRIQEMEKRIEELNVKLAEKDRLYAENSKIPIEMEQSVKKKDAEIQGLRVQLRSAQERISNLEQEITDKEVYMEKLQSKSKILDEVVGFRGSLEGLLSYLKIVQEMEDTPNVSDVNDNLRETEITDGYQSEDEHTQKGSVVVNGLQEHCDSITTVTDHR